jgi:hypothetical protein
VTSSGVQSKSDGQHEEYPVDCDLGRPPTSDFSRCDYRAAQMKHTVVYGSARTVDFNRGD